VRLAWGITKLNAQHGNPLLLDIIAIKYFWIRPTPKKCPKFVGVIV